MKRSKPDKEDKSDSDLIAKIGKSIFDWDQTFRMHSLNHLAKLSLFNRKLISLYGPSAKPAEINFPSFSDKKVILTKIEVRPKTSVVVPVSRLVKTKDKETLPSLPYYETSEEYNKFMEKLDFIKVFYKKLNIKTEMQKNIESFIQENPYNDFLVANFVGNFGLSQKNLRILAFIMGKHTTVVEDYIEKLRDKFLFKNYYKRTTHNDNVLELS